MAAAKGGSGESLVHDMARRMLVAFDAQRGAFNLIFTEIVEVQGRHISDLFPLYFGKLYNIFERISPERAKESPVLIQILVRSFLGSVFSYFQTSVALSDRLPYDDDTFEALIDVYLHGIF